MFIALATTSKDPDVRPVLQRIANALEVQLYQHYAPFWQSSGMNVRVVEANAAVLRTQECSPLIVYDNADEPGALGYHSLAGEAQVFGKAFWKVIHKAGGTLIEGANSLSCTLSHEVLEMVGNPYVNFWTDMNDTTQEAVELCLAGDTKVVLADGQRVTIQKLSEEGGFFDVLSHRSGSTVSARAGHARLTYKDAQTVRVVMTDGSSVRCTPEHRLLCADGTYRKASSLLPGTRLEASHATPQFTPSNLVNDGLVDAESSSDDVSQLFGGDNLQDEDASELGAAVGFSSPTPVASHPTLARGIQHVRMVTSHKKTIGIRARRIVTTMTDRKALGYLALVQLERDSVGIVNLAPVSNLSVPGVIHGPIPAPTSRSGLQHLHPVALSESGPSLIKGDVTSIQGPMPMHPLPMRRAESLRSEQSRTTLDGAIHPKIVDRVELAGKCDVFDLTVPGTRNFAIEAGVFVHNCDRVEADAYEIDGVSVSNFLGPRAFREGPGPYDWMRLLKTPFELRPGGYVIRRKGDKVFNLWGKDFPEFKKSLKTAPDSRLALRQALITSKGDY